MQYFNKSGVDYVDKCWCSLFYNPLQKVEENNAMCGHTQLIREGGEIVQIIQTPSKAQGPGSKMLLVLKANMSRHQKLHPICLNSKKRKVNKALNSKRVKQKYVLKAI